MLQLITGPLKHRKDVIERFVSHRAFIYCRLNDTGRVDAFHLLPEFIHRECLVGCLPGEPSAGSMRCGHVVISIAFASADQGSLLHRYRYKYNLSVMRADSTFPDDHILGINVVVDRLEVLIVFKALIISEICFDDTLSDKAAVEGSILTGYPRIMEIVIKVASLKIGEIFVDDPAILALVLLLLLFYIVCMISISLYVYFTHILI